MNSKLLFVILSIICLSGCENDDKFKDDSAINVNPSSVSINYEHESVITLVETDTKYPFSATIDEPVEYDVVLKVNLVSATATRGKDFEFPNEIIIKAGTTSGNGTIEIFSDDIAEELETFKLSIGGITINGQTKPVEVTFNITNLTSEDLVIDMTWTSPTDFTDNLGAAIEDEDIADLILYIADPNIPTSTNYISVDNEFGFETFVFLESYPDGDYHLVGDFFSARDYGGVYADLDISLTFNQIGIINDEIITVAAALNTEYASCQSIVLAKITKDGTTYTFEKIGIRNNAGIPADGTFVGEYAVATTSGGEFGPAFDAASVTLVDEGNGVRSFVGDWNGFGVEATYEFQFNPACGTATFIDGQDTGLSCGGPNIIHGASSNAGVIVDPTDDSFLILTYTENTERACGRVPTDVTITFTKL